MSSEKKPIKRLYTFAAAVGLALGTMGVAAAVTAPDQTAPVTDQTQTDRTAPATSDQLVDTADTGEAPEAPTDEAVDGIDHQSEGEEIGNNGDGIPDANEADEVETPDGRGQ